MTLQLQEITKVGPEALTHKESNLFPLPGCRVGVEIEVENIHEYIKGDIAGFWKQKSDNSLRDGGTEFISSPMRGKDITKSLILINQWLSERNPSFSHRTSVHVHLDCTDLSVEQLKSILLLYIYFEVLLFKFISPERLYNNYCVPILKTPQTITDIATLFSETINTDVVQRAFNNWHKYQALNLKRLNDLGTLEFRHCEGTANYKFILKWIKIIQCLKRAAISHPFSYFATTIEKISSPMPLIGLVFGSNSRALLSKSTDLLNECNRQLALDLCGSYVLAGDIALNFTSINKTEESSYYRFKPKKGRKKNTRNSPKKRRLHNGENRPPTIDDLTRMLREAGEQRERQRRIVIQAPPPDPGQRPPTHFIPDNWTTTFENTVILDDVNNDEGED